MVNWPGWNGGTASPAGSMRKVTESWVSAWRSTTRYGTGSIVSRSALTRAPVQVEQPGPGALQPRQQDLDESQGQWDSSGALQPRQQDLDESQGQWVAERRILLRERAQRRGIQLDRRDRPLRGSGEVPVVRRHQP